MRTEKEILDEFIDDFDTRVWKQIRLMTNLEAKEALMDIVEEIEKEYGWCEE